MTAMTSTTTQTFFPYLRYADAPAAIAFLKDAFGFEPQLVVDGPDGTVAHAQLRFGAGLVMLGTGSGQRTPDDLAGSNGVYVFVEDIDAHYARAKQAGASITRPIAEMEYGSREYSALDCEGNHWSFGTYRPAVE